MRSLLGRFHRPMSRGLVNNMLTMNNLGDGSTLNLDFTTMGGVLDPRLTFSRASTATFVNSSGYVEYAAHNLYYNTNFETITTGTSNPSLTSKGWSYVFSTGSATFNVDGSVTMSASAQRIGLLRSAGFAGTGRRLIFSVDITSVGDTGLPPSQLVNEGTKTNDAYYINGILWTSGNVVGPCTLSFAFDSSTSGNASTYFGLGMSGTVTGSATFANPRWGLYGGVNQFAYFPNTSATNANYLTAEYHAPRFDYSPTNIGEPRGLLVEGNVTNFITQSQALSGYAAYGMMAISIDGTVPDPMGGVETKKIAASTSATSAFHGFLRNATNAGAATTVTVSIFAKRNNYKYLNLFDGSSATASTRFNLDTGVTDQTLGGGYVSSKMTPYPNGWYRCEMTANVPANINRSWGFQAVADTATYASTGASYIGTGNINDGIYVIGWQVEAGSGASSYIPTGASQVTRNRDTAVMSDISALNYTNAAGTLFVDFTNNTENANYAGSIAFNNGANYAQRFRLGVGSLLVSYFQTNGITGLGTNLFGARTSFARAKTASSYSFDGTTTTTLMSMNGAAASVTPSSSAAASVSIPTNLSLNSDNSSGALDYVSMTIRSIKYFPTAKSLVDMNGLTT